MDILTDTFDAFGLDIGDRSLKAVHLAGRGKNIRVRTHGSCEVPKGVFEKGTLVAPDKLCASLRALLASCAPKKIKTRYVHACLPETHTFIKLLEFSDVSGPELGARVREELPSHVPLDIDDAYIDWTVVGTTDQGGLRVLAGAIPKQTSDSYTNALRACGLIPLSLQVEAQAIVRALVDRNAPLQGPLAIVDIGATRSSFILYDRGSIQFTVSIPSSGEDATEAIASKLSISYEEAENAKRTMGLDPGLGEGTVAKILAPMALSLTSAIQKNCMFYGEHFPGTQPVAGILLCGGGAAMPGFLGTLSDTMPGIAIAHGNPVLHVAGGEEAGLGLSHTTAIGLALTQLI
ncbi:MAG: pilus assembly protein PilM [Parcubacteria group bacterium]|nr:pilus assembly protein PilM [Parcubacteria group bacterium]